MHAERYRDSSVYAWPNEADAFVYMDTFSALEACVRLRPGWLEAAIARASVPADPVFDLAYLVAAVEVPGLWRSVKGRLVAMVEPARSRAIARCIEVYRDEDLIPWLEARLGQSQHLEGSSALRALTRLSFERGLKGLTGLEDWDLYATRGWHVGPLLLLHGDQTRKRLLELLESHPEPWRAAPLFQGSEDSIGPEIYTVILKSVVRLMKSHLLDQASEHPHYFQQIRFLNEVSDPALLTVLQQEREGDLERELLRWLQAVGPQKGRSRQPEKLQALELLGKIGGPGITAAVNLWLDEGDRGARLDAYAFAARRPDQRTVQLLRQQAIEGRDGERSPEPGHAAVALAECSRWSDVLSYIRRAGAQTLRAVGAFRHEAGRRGQGESAPVVPTPGPLSTEGDILAAGFAGWSEMAPDVLRVLEAEVQGSAMALSCLIALEWLEDHSEEAVAVVARFLESHPWPATATLLTNASSAAMTALKDHVAIYYDHGLSVAVAATRLAGPELDLIIGQRIQHADDDKCLEMLADLNAEPSLGEFVGSLLADRRLRGAVATRAAAPDTGSRSRVGRLDAIRLMAHFDVGAAFAAAKEAMQTETVDRHAYVWLLADIDGAAALPELRRHAVSEPDILVLWSIGRALEAGGGAEEVRPMFVSTVAVERQAACLLAERLSPRPWIWSALVRCFTADASADVASAAQAALQMQRTAEVAADLHARLIAEQDEAHQWTLLDALVAAADPGDEGRGSPAWAHTLLPHLKEGMRQRLRASVGRRKKEVRDLGRRRKRAD